MEKRDWKEWDRFPRSISERDANIFLLRFCEKEKFTKIAKQNHLSIERVRNIYFRISRDLLKVL